MGWSGVHAGDSVVRSSGRFKRETMTAAQYAPLHTRHRLDSGKPWKGDEKSGRGPQSVFSPHVDLAASGHLKASAGLLQSTQPFPQGASVHDLVDVLPSDEG